VDKFAKNFTVHLTALSPGMIGLYTSRVKNGKFIVTGSPGEFFYIVYAERRNQTFDIEPLKTNCNIKGSGPYKWI
jgi:hypothetical protein